MVTPEESGLLVAGSAATENGVPAMRDPSAQTPQGTDATDIGGGGEGKEEGVGGGEGRGGTDASATTVKAVGIDPSEHGREGQNDLGNAAGNGLRDDAPSDVQNDVGIDIENGAGDGAADSIGNGIGHDARKACPVVGTSETLPAPGRPARRLSESSVRFSP